MATLTHVIQQHVSVPADKLFKVFVLEMDQYMPKIMGQTGQTLKSADTLQGSGYNTGAIKKFSFVQGGKHKTAKHVVDVLDTTNYTFGYTCLESDSWDVDGLEKASFLVKYLPAPDGGSIYKNEIKYYAKAGCKLDEQQIKAFEEMLTGVAKSVEAYVQANPNI